MAAYWMIEVSYAGFNPVLDQKLEELAGPRTGSGAGFGQRDMDWIFTYKEEAEEKLAILLEYAKTVPVDWQVSVRMHDMDDDEEDE